MSSENFVAPSNQPTVPPIKVSKTVVIRIDLNAGDPLTRIQDECNIRLAVGYSLRGCFNIGSEVVLIFQPDNIQNGQ